MSNRRFSKLKKKASRLLGAGARCGFRLPKAPGEFRRATTVAFIMAAPVAPKASDALAAANAVPAVAAVRQPSPVITAPDASGDPRSSSNLRNRKILILTFFPRCFTFNCANQLSSFRDSYGEYQRNGAEVWGISVDKAGGSHGQRAFAAHLKIPFPLIPDPDRKICLAYGAVQAPDQMATRMTVIIDRDGIVRDIDRQITPRTQGPDVLAKLRALKLIPTG